MNRCVRKISVALLLGIAGLACAQPAMPVNPLRGNTRVIDAGRLAYQTHCAECHGQEAVNPIAEAPDLRMLNSFCRRLSDTALNAHCLADVDRYFLRSVSEGKVRAGVRYMPAWADRLTPEEIWSIRSFIETRPMPARPARP